MGNVLLMFPGSFLIIQIISCSERSGQFLKSRCFPETRDKIKIQLDALGIPFYDPMLIIGKTQGRMAEDDFWIMIEK